jgi:hypothetical protein
MRASALRGDRLVDVRSAAVDPVAELPQRETSSSASDERAALQLDTMASLLPPASW